MTDETDDKIVPFPVKRHSPVVTSKMAGKIKTMIDIGMNQHDIAAYFKINQGRISEIKTGLKYPGVEPTQPDFFQ